MAEKKILLIDDDQDVVRALFIRLKSRGYQVAVAGDAIAAISTARKEKPDLIVLDIGLPGGDGFVVMKRLKALYDFSLTPVIVLSARDAAATRDLALQAGASAYFQKPVKTTEFLNAIQRALGETAAGQGA